MTRTLKPALAVSLALHVVVYATLRFAMSGEGEPARQFSDLPVVLLVSVQEDFLAPPPEAPPVLVTPPPKLEPVPVPTPTPVVESPVAPIAALKPERADVPNRSTPSESKSVGAALSSSPASPAIQASNTGSNAIAVVAPIRPAVQPGPSLVHSSADAVFLSGRVKYRRAPDPEYPLLARRRKQEGTVLLEVAIATNGHPVGVVLKQSSGFPALDRAALDAVPHWEFEISSTVPVRAEIPVRFQLVK